MPYYFIFVMMPIRAAKQRRNGIAEPRSGRSDGEGEREQRRSESRRNEVTEREHGGAGLRNPASIPDIIRCATIHNIHTIRIRDITRIDIWWFTNILLK